MQLQDIRKEVASYINRLDSSDVLIESDITKLDLNRFINSTGEEIYQTLQFKQGARGSQNAFTPTYQISGTVSSDSTSTTLVATEAIFSNGMKYAIVYNNDLGTTAKITAYTNSTTVTLDTTIGDDWDGDTIYIFTGEYTFSGDITDFKKIDWVGIKYKSTDTDYTRALPLVDRDAFEFYRGDDANQLFLQDKPKYIYEQQKVNNTAIMAIKIRPIPSVVIEDGVFARYSEAWKVLSNDTDEPNIPKPHVALVYGATAKALRKMKDPSNAQMYEQLYRDAVSQLTTFNETEPIKRYIKFNRPTNRNLQRYK